MLEPGKAVEHGATVALVTLVAGIVIALYLEPLWQILDRVPLVYGEGWKPGPVVCEMLALCYWAGKPYEIDFFNAQQKLILGIVAPDSLVDHVDARGYGAIALTTNTPPDERLPDAVMMHLRMAYCVARVSPNGWTILLPINPR